MRFRVKIVIGVVLLSIGYVIVRVVTWQKEGWKLREGLEEENLTLYGNLFIIITEEKDFQEVRLIKELQI